MKTNEADNPTLFEEQNNFLAQTSCVTCEPNYEYLMEQYKYGWGQLFTKRPTWFTLHNNGWLELHVSMAADQVARRTNRRITQYQKKVGPARNTKRGEIEIIEETHCALKKTWRCCVGSLAHIRNDGANRTQDKPHV